MKGNYASWTAPGVETLKDEKKRTASPGKKRIHWPARIFVEELRVKSGEHGAQPICFSFDVVLFPLLHMSNGSASNIPCFQLVTIACVIMFPKIFLWRCIFGIISHSLRPVKKTACLFFVFLEEPFALSRNVCILKAKENDRLRGEKTMNIREFAALCGVAHSTVSRVMNLSQKDSRTSRATYDRIRAKAAEVGFRVNYHAKALHSRKSNCFGFIVGSWMPMLTEPLLFGISRTLNPKGKNLAIYPCDTTYKAEAEAFDRMMYYGVDAILYISSLQKGLDYSTAHIRKVLETYPEYPPVVTLYGGTNIPGFYQLRFRDYELGKQAAVRQLACGCRKFGIFIPLYSTYMSRRQVRGYRDTLLKNGILSEDIREVSFWPAEVNDGVYSRLKDVDGIWCSHYR